MMRVGRQVRERRNEVGLSLRELARLTDLSGGFLSQVENDQVSPSLSSLGRIADALHVPIFRLLSVDGRCPVVRAEDRPVVDLNFPEMIVELLTPFLTWQLLPYLRKLDPGEKHEAVRLGRESEEWMFVLTGEVEIHLADDEPYHLRPGDTVHFASERLVSLTTVGDERVEMICMMTPPAL